MNIDNNKICWMNIDNMICQMNIDNNNICWMNIYNNNNICWMNAEDDNIYWMIIDCKNIYWILIDNKTNVVRISQWKITNHNICMSAIINETTIVNYCLNYYVWYNY